MNVLVTGSEGNVGSELVPYLESKGHKVMCLDVVQKYRKNYILCDVRNLSDAESEVREFRPDVVFHLAAMVSRVTCEKSPTLATDVNLNGTANVIELCKRYDSLLINFSTSEVYGNQEVSLEEDIELMPNNLYGLTKKLCEDLVRYHADNHGLRYVNVRPFMMYSENESMGENRSAMVRFAESIIRGSEMEVHIGAKRSWLHMTDAVVIFERLMGVDRNETVNVGNSDFIDIEYMARKMCDIENVGHDIIKLTPLPERMTLSKKSSFEKQLKLTGYTPKMEQIEGFKRVMRSVKTKIENESINSHPVL